MIAAPGDQIRVSARTVTQLDSAFVAHPVTSGATAILSVEDWESAQVISGPDAMTQSGSSNDYYADINAPAAKGKYRLVVVLSKGGAQRTLWSELEVKDPPT